VLAISRLACKQFIAAGFDNSLIFPYGYFVDARVPEISVRERKRGKILRFAYIGTLIKRKGYDIAINAFSTMIAEGNGVELDLYGMSEGKEWNANSFSGIRHCGMLPFGKTQAALTQYDAVVVPSRYDGWSVVVNEAIIAGTPIIVSRNVGASDLVATHLLGLVYDGTEEGLSNALREIVRAPHRLERWSQAEQAFAPNIRPARAAQYLVDVLRFGFEGGVRPRCPWYQLGEES
jgi:glycosyltransferase involved in cell wall biosynthesis